jgi:excisionase family DNA binding protein
VTDAPPPDHLASYSTAYVAKRLGVSIPTVQRWVDAGQLKAWKTLGGHRRIEAESAERLFATQASGAAASGEFAEAAPESAAPASVMIVDDNPDDRDLLALLVSSALPSARVTNFESGIQALVAIGQTAPDIVITDVVMPDMNGLAMLRQLSTQCVVRPRLIVAVSSMTRKQLARLGELPTEVKLVTKPIDPHSFIEMVRAGVA